MITADIMMIVKNTIGVINDNYIEVMSIVNDNYIWYNNQYK